MTASRPWEPPLAGTDVEHLLGAIDRQRWTFCYKTDGLDLEALSATLASSSLSLGVLLKHLTVCEDVIFSFKLAGEQPASYGDHDADDEEWTFTLTSDDTAESLYAGWAEAAARSHETVRRVLAERGIDGPAHLGEVWGEPVSVRRVLTDYLEEIARHTGHADLLREMVDGRVGEDPPDDWRPVSSPGPGADAA